MPKSMVTKEGETPKTAKKKYPVPFFVPALKMEPYWNTTRDAPMSTVVSTATNFSSSNVTSTRTESLVSAITSCIPTIRVQSMYAHYSIRSI